MFKKSLVLAALAAGLLVPTISRATNTDSGTITITATVESYFEWDSGNTYAVDKDTGWTGGTGTSASHIGKPGDVIQASQPLTVNTNTDPVFTLTGLTNSGVLTEAGTSTTLKTSYKLSTHTLGSITASNAGFFDAAGIGALSAFNAANTWTLTHSTTGTSNLNLEVKAEIPSGITLPKAANYTCTVKITAAW
jgi:hypothetical protein